MSNLRRTKIEWRDIVLRMLPSRMLESICNDHKIPLKYEDKEGKIFLIKNRWNDDIADTILKCIERNLKE